MFFSIAWVTASHSESMYLLLPENRPVPPLRRRMPHGVPFPPPAEELVRGGPQWVADHPRLIQSLSTHRMMGWCVQWQTSEQSLISNMDG